MCPAKYVQAALLLLGHCSYAAVHLRTHMPANRTIDGTT